MIQWMTDIQIP